MGVGEKKETVYKVGFVTYISNVMTKQVSLRLRATDKYHFYYCTLNKWTTIMCYLVGVKAILCSARLTKLL